MSELDREEDAVLDSARRALTPSAVVTKRMRVALLAKLAAPAAAAAVGTAAPWVEGLANSPLASSSTLASGAKVAASGAKVAASGASALATGAKVAVSGALLKAAAAVTTTTLLATAGGYYLSATEEAPPAAAFSAAATPASAPGERAARAPEPHGVVTHPVTKSEATSTQPPRSAAIAGSTPAIVLPHAAPSVGNEQLLQAELDVLKRVRQALQVGDAPRALSLLAELDAKQPVSALWQEREVARVLALCGTGRVAAARAAAERLLGPNPNSLYAERIQASCAASRTETPTPANTPGNSHAAESTQSSKVAPPVARFGDSGN